MNIKRAKVFVARLRLHFTAAAASARLVVKRSHNFVVDQRREHLRLEKLQQKRPILRRLVGQKRRFVKVVHRLAVLQPLGLVLVRQNHELLVVEEDLAEAVEKNLANLGVESKIVVILLVIRETSHRRRLRSGRFRRALVVILPARVARKVKIADEIMQRVFFPSRFAQSESR